MEIDAANDPRKYEDCWQITNEDYPTNEDWWNEDVSWVGGKKGGGKGKANWGKAGPYGGSKGSKGKGKSDGEGKTGKGKSEGKGGFKGECWTCGKIGHSVRNCPMNSNQKGESKGGFQGNCYKCGAWGHTAGTVHQSG